MDPERARFVANLTVQNSAAAAVHPNGTHVYLPSRFADGSLGISVFDIRQNKVVARIENVGVAPISIAITPDGKFGYLPSSPFVPEESTVSVFATDRLEVTATIPVDYESIDIFMAPDGTRVYVNSFWTYDISVIDTKTDKVVDRTRRPELPSSLAVTRDGKCLYTADVQVHSVSVMDATTKNTVATIPVTYSPYSIALAPDGTHAYVGTVGPLHKGTLDVIDTKTNKVVASIALTERPFHRRIAVTPDGRRIILVVERDGVGKSVKEIVVIGTTTNSVVGRLYPQNDVSGVAIVPPPPGLPFADYKIAHLDLHPGAAPNQKALAYCGFFTLDHRSSNGISPEPEPVTLHIGTFSATIPAGSFRKLADGSFAFLGLVGNRVPLYARIKPVGAYLYSLWIDAKSANLDGTANPVRMRLIIGDDAGLSTVEATITSPP